MVRFSKSAHIIAAHKIRRLRLTELASRFDVVQRLWSMGCDRDWHSPEELAERLPLSTQEVRCLLNFLVRYGFAEMRMELVMKVRMKDLGPSPAEAAGLLRMVCASGMWMTDDAS